MLPTGLIPRAKCRELSRFHDTRLEPALRLLFSNVDPATRSGSEVEEAHAEITKRLTALCVLLDQSPLPRDRLWLCDCGLIVTLEWLDIMERHSVLPALHWSGTVRSYRAQMAALPDVTQELPPAYVRMDAKQGGRGEETLIFLPQRGSQPMPNMCDTLYDHLRYLSILHAL